MKHSTIGNIYSTISKSLQMCKSVNIIEILERKVTNVNNKQEKYYE